VEDENTEQLDYISEKMEKVSEALQHVIKEGTWSDLLATKVGGDLLAATPIIRQALKSRCWEKTVHETIGEEAMTPRKAIKELLDNPISNLGLQKTFDVQALQRSGTSL
jgi:hypothetical protein